MKKLLLVLLVPIFTACGFFPQKTEYRCVGTSKSQYYDDRGNATHKDSKYEVVLISVLGGIDYVNFEGHGLEIKNPHKLDFIQHVKTFDSLSPAKDYYSRTSWWFDVTQKTLHRERNSEHLSTKKPHLSFSVEEKLDAKCSIVKS